jgi:hypothetical protein
MRRSIVLVSAAALFGGCGQSNEAANQAAASAAQPKKKAAHCFFKDSETKDWKASRGKDGNIVVKGKAYRSDSRYKAVLGTPELTATTVSIAPSITVNNTGYGAPDNWWDISASIPGSAAVDTVMVTCGAKTVAELKVPTKA